MAHRWKFARVGGFDQVQLRTGQDLVSIGELDQKLWVALACPIKGLELDERTLSLIDTDKDGRVRASELIAATKWVAEVLKDVDVLAKGSVSLALSAIDDEEDEGKLLLKSAKKILKSLGKPDAKEISVADMKDAIGAFEKEKLNGDGVVPPETAEDATLKKVVEDGLSCTAAPPKDKSGKDGLDEAATKAFFEAIRAHADWLKKGKTEESLRPLGDDTAAAYAAFAALKAKIDDYFARGRVAAYDPRALAAVNGEEKAYLEIAAKDLNVSAAEVAHFPIAQVAVDKPLPFGKGVNPAWSDRVAALSTAVVKPLLGAKESLTQAEWRTISDKLAPYGAYVADKKGASVEKLGAARVEELAASDLEKKLLDLVAEDKALAPEAQAIEKVEKLVRYNRDLMEIANNFVSFRDFYSRRKPAAFQIGTLYLDQRACELCIEVNDAGRHATMAPLANTYLVYCDLKNSKGQTKQIAAAMTAGDVDNLMVGRNGVFYDRKGLDWDATITKIIDNPISVRQAFWSPYKKALRMVEEFVASRAAAAQADADAKLTADVHAATAAAATPPAPGAAPDAPAAPAAPATQTRPLDIGVVAALGVAVGGITAALGAFLEAFFGLGLWMPLGVLGLILAISGPSMAVAWLKLRKRNLGPILDANGWALNAMATVNVPLGGSLTKEAVLPDGSERDLSDPFAEQPRPWRFYVFVLVVLGLAIGWYVGKLDHYLPVAARSVTVLGENAPAYVAPEGAAAAPAEAAPAPAAE
jgi:hypothetical protein